MEHLHDIRDDDTHFIIDANTRTINNTSGNKFILMQYDHNCERYTFEIPRYIDGHDMSLCNAVQIQYQINDKTGFYTVTDLQIDAVDENIVLFSWLIDYNTTQIVGVLNFLIRFSCVSDDGICEYVWNTGIYSGVTISKGMYFTNGIVEEYIDEFEQLKKELFDYAVKSEKDLIDSSRVRLYGVKNNQDVLEAPRPNTDESESSEAADKNTKGYDRFLGEDVYIYQNTIMRRDGNGRCSVLMPVRPKHIANKEYVDSAIRQAVIDSWEVGV